MKKLILSSAIAVSAFNLFSQNVIRDYNNNPNDNYQNRLTVLQGSPDYPKSGTRWGSGERGIGIGDVSKNDHSFNMYFNDTYETSSFNIYGGTGYNDDPKFLSIDRYGNTSLYGKTYTDRLEIGGQSDFNGYTYFNDRTFFNGKINVLNKLVIGNSLIVDSPYLNLFVAKTNDAQPYTSYTDFKGELIYRRIEEVNGRNEIVRTPFAMFKNGIAAIGVDNNERDDLRELTSSDYSLYVGKGIRTESVKVDLASKWADYVFAEDYNLKSLDEVESYIEENNHLPDVPSEAVLEEEGLDLAEMQKIQMQKIEELTLYIIEQNKKIELLQVQMEKASK